VAAKTIGGIYDEAITQELDRLSIETTASLIPEHSNHSKFAAVLLAEFIRKEVAGQGIESFSQSFLALHRLGMVPDRGNYFVQSNKRNLDNAIDDNNSSFE
jgi:ribonucleoside-diphosphate reductase alpha chain